MRRHPPDRRRCVRNASRRKITCALPLIFLAAITLMRGRLPASAGTEADGRTTSHADGPCGGTPAVIPVWTPDVVASIHDATVVPGTTAAVAAPDRRATRDLDDIVASLLRATGIVLHRPRAPPRAVVA